MLLAMKTRNQKLVRFDPISYWCVWIRALILGEQKHEALLALRYMYL